MNVRVVIIQFVLGLLVVASYAARGQQLILNSVSTTSTFTISLSNVYQWQIQELVNDNYVTILSGSASQTGPFSITKPNGFYTYRLYNCIPYSGCNYSISSSVEVAVAPAIPASISVTPGTSSISISWSSVSGASRYEWRRDSGTIYSGVALNYTDTAAVVGTYYTYSVRACYSSSCSAWKTSPSVRIVPPASSSSSYSSSSVPAAVQTFTYDALGRLTFVNDSRAGMNRDYDYDAAGNRTNVSVGTSSD